MHAVKCDSVDYSTSLEITFKTIVQCYHIADVLNVLKFIFIEIMYRNKQTFSQGSCHAVDPSYLVQEIVEFLTIR